MNSRVLHGRRNHSDNVRDCFQQRGQGHHSTSRRSHAGGRPPRAESAQDLLRQLPTALGGYRLPASADSPGVRVRAHDAATLASEDLLLPVAIGGFRPLPAAENATGAHVHATSGHGPANTSALERAFAYDGGMQNSSSSPSLGDTLRRVPEQLPDIRAAARQRHRAVASRRQFTPDPAAGERFLGRRAATDSPAPRRQLADQRCPAGPSSLLSKAVDPNARFRQYMEDRYVSIDPFMAGECDNERWEFYAIYDGHGGSQAADYCESELHKVFMGELRTELREQRIKNPSAADQGIANAFTRTFRKVDDQLRINGAWHLGCTATVALLRRVPFGCRLHVANVGDSRAIAIDARGSYRLSQDHRPTDPAEARRVQQVGGIVSMGRVGGELAVSRALGDHSLKDRGVSWQPHTHARDATHDIAFVIASDGLWDTLDDDDVRIIFEQSRQENVVGRVAQRLVEDAKHRGSMDNIACLVVVP